MIDLFISLVPMRTISSALAYCRCTVGEISSALEDAWGRHNPSTAVVRGAYSASYNEAVGVRPQVGTDCPELLSLPTHCGPCYRALKCFVPVHRCSDRACVVKLFGTGAPHIITHVVVSQYSRATPQRASSLPDTSLTLKVD